MLVMEKTGRSPKTDEKDSYIKTLQDEIVRREAEKKALLEEFKQEIIDTWTPEDIKKKIGELMPVAFQTLRELILEAESESVRLNAAQYVFNLRIGKIKITDDNSSTAALTELLSNIGVADGDESDQSS